MRPLLREGEMLRRNSGNFVGFRDAMIPNVADSRQWPEDVIIVEADPISCYLAQEKGL